MNTSLRQAKSRWKRRRDEGGAALFVVAMSLTVLASLGIYALAAASNEVKTSGYERQNTQTHYLATYGILGAAHEMTSTKAQLYMRLMITLPDKCPGSLPGVGATGTATANPQSLACRRIGGPEMAAGWTAGPNYVDAYTGTAPYQTSATPGSFGPTPITGDFFVELTEPTQAQPPAGYGLGLNFCFVEMTATSNGITRPFLSSSPNWTQTYGNEGIEVQRARILAGPVACPK